MVEQASVELYYDYDRLPEAHRETIRRAAINIKPRLKRAAEDLFVIGRELRATKERLPHGEYSNWLDQEFGLSDRMAQRFVSVYDRLGVKSDIMSVLPPTTLYMLAAPSTPDEAIEDIEEQIETGERLSVSYVQSVISDAKKRKAHTVAGTVISSRIVETNVDTAEAAGRLENVLTQAFDLFSDQAGDDWSALFRNSELTRVRNEIYQLREEVRTRISASGNTVRKRKESQPKLDSN